MAETPLVEMRHMSIAFGGVHAVEDVSIELHAGEVVGLLGHNGAGKSCLIKMLSGAYQRDAGEIYIDGAAAEITNPRDAKSYGIETIYQTLALADNIDAPANLFLGRELRTAFGTLDDVAMEAATRQVMHRLNGSQPVIGVCALNPHAGEQGLFGDEEQTVIAPAIERAASEGLSIVGPLPADTLMVRSRDGEFDAVVAMYHDQGHIALKLLGLFDAVNITLGLPIIRTSVAHGTAFDLAWQGRAESRSMVEAVCTAAQLASGSRHETSSLSVP